MPDTLRTVITFQSAAFNTSEVHEYFINACCFGDDVTNWLMERLRRKGLLVGEAPGQEDFGWYFTFRMAEIEHCFLLGYRPSDGKEEGTWIGWLERHYGLVGSLLGGRKRGIRREAAEAIHQSLASAAEIRNLQWHLRADFDKGREDLGTSVP